MGQISEISQKLLVSDPYLYTRQMIACRRGGVILKKITILNKLKFYFQMDHVLNLCCYPRNKTIVGT